jgi:hypothetical protein
MKNILDPRNGLIFMKIGLHAQESIDDIIKRKRQEFDKAGKIFWGYGGNTCHPTSMVQPFAKEVSSRKGAVLLVMHKMNSKHNAPPALANEYSDDGINWQPIPKGIQVRGSRYALVLDQLQDIELELPLDQLGVAIGRSRGAVAESYLRGHVDKGCFEIMKGNAAPTKETKHIDLVASVKAPYAVFLR